MKKLTKSAKIILVSILSAICVLGVVLGCIFAFPKKDPNNPNNPTPNEPSGPVISYTEKNDINSFNSAPYKDICDSDDLSLLGKDYFIYVDSNGNKQLAVFKEINGSFDVKVLTSSDYDFVKKDAKEFKIVAYNNNYAVIQNIFDKTNELYENKVYSVVYFGGSAPVEVYSIATNGECEVYVDASCMTDNYLVFQEMKIINQENYLISVDVKYILLDNEKKISKEEYLLQNIETSTNGSGSKFDINILDKNYVSYVKDNEIGIFYLQENTFKNFKFEFENILSYSLYKCTDKQLLLSVSESSDVYDYYILNLVGSELTKTNYQYTDGYIGIYNIESKDNYYFICEQKYIDNYENIQEYIYKYYDKESNLLLSYKSKYSNDKIMNLYKDSFCTRNGIYKLDNDQYVLSNNFSNNNYIYDISNEYVVVLFDYDNSNYKILDIANNCQELLSGFNFNNVFDTGENCLILENAKNESFEYYIFNYKNKTNENIQNIYLDEYSRMLFNYGYYITEKDSEDFVLHSVNQKKIEFSYYDAIETFDNGYIFNFYKNDNLVFILSLDVNNETYVNYNINSASIIVPYAWNTDYTRDATITDSSGNTRGTFYVYTHETTWGYHNIEYEIIMNKGYKFSSTGSTVSVTYASSVNHTICDKESSGTWAYGNGGNGSLSNASIDWSGENRRYYVYHTDAYYWSDAAYPSTSIIKTTVEKITYTITLYKNGGSGGTTSTTVYWDNKIGYVNIPSRTGYLFSGYYDSTSGGTQYIYSSGYGSKNWDKSGSFSYILYAHWTPITYYIRFDSNKPSSASYSPTGTINSITATYNSKVTLPSSTYSLTGWTFLGWSTSRYASSASYSASRTLYSPNFTTINGATTTLYAVWSANKYYIKLGGGSGTISSLGVASGSSGLTLSGTTYTATFDQIGKISFNAQRTGYMFNGWSRSPSYSYTNLMFSTDLSSITNGTYVNTLNAISLVTQVRNLSTGGSTITLTATWTPITYKVQIAANGGATSSYGVTSNASVSSSIFTLTYGSTGIFYNSIKKTGYMFTGYSLSGTYLYSNKSYSQSYTNVDESTTAIKVTSTALNLTYYRGATVTLTASWSAIKYFIDYNSNKPSIASSTVQGTVNTTEMYYDSTTNALATNNFTLTGWTFLGWSQNSSATTASYASGAKPSRLNATTKRNSTVVMYAIWKQNTYTITFSGNGGTVNSFSAVSGLTMPTTTSFKATYDQQGVFTNLAIRTGYMFAGWTISTGLGSANATPNSAYSNFDDYYDANADSASSISVKTTILNLTPTNNATVSLSAVWTPISYYIKLESGANDAYVSSLANVSNTVLSGSLFQVSYNTTGVISNKIKRDGYTFNGWTNSGAGTVTPSYTTIDDTTTAITIQTTVNNLTYIHKKTITLTARWNAINYYIQLAGNGGTITGLANVSNLPLDGSKFQATYDLEGVLSANIVRAGYKFTNFKNTSSKGTVSTVPYNGSYIDFANYYSANPETQSNVQVKTTAKNLTTTRGATIELTAEWSAISYTLHYNGNKPSVSTYSPVGSTSNSYATYDKTVTFSANGFSIIGWTSLGWSDTASDTTAKFASGGTVSKNFTTIDGGTVEIYSIWRKNNYTINYVMNSGSKTSSKIYTVNAQFDTVFFVDTLERIGYTFASYTISNMSTNNTKLIGQSNPPTISLGESVTTYENMKTSGYYKNLTSEDNGVVNFEAFWTPNKYSLSYNFSGGEGNGVYPTTATYDIVFPVSAPKRLGYTFAGWNIAGMDTVCDHYYGDNTTKSETITKTLATSFKNLRATDGTVTFTAIWNANVYKISYDYANGGESAGLSYPKTMTYDSWSTINNPVRTGYTFIGWSVSGMSKTCVHYYGQSSSSYKTTESQNLSVEDNSTILFKNLHSETDETVLFTANWVANTYNIRYELKQNGLEGGKLEVVSSSVKYDEILQVNAPSAYPFGYHFNGWIISSMSTNCQHYYGSSSTNVTNETGMVETFHTGAKDKYFKNLHSTNGATVVFTADWEANSYNLKYILTDSRGGDGSFSSSSPAPTTAKYDVQFTIPTPVRTGYSFVGWSFAGLSDSITHYYSTNNTAFSSQNGSYAVDGNTNAVIKSGTFKNLHYQSDATVTLTASWKANEYTITYHYLDGNYNTSLLTDSTINTYTTSGGSWKTKSQSVVYDAMFTTMKMAKSDSDTTGVVVPANVKIIYWIFYASPVDSNHRFATNDENQNPIPEHAYYLGVGTEYVYSSYELFNTYPLFGSNVHAYAIYGFTDITLKFMGANSKIDFNNMSGYTLKSETGTKISQDVSLPSALDSQKVLGYMISANIYSGGELNVGSITTDELNGVKYTANAGSIIKWARSSSDAFDPENPTFYLYAIYDTSIKSFYTPQIYTNSDWQAIGLNTVGMFTAGKTYSITISGLESASQYDYNRIKLSSQVGSYNADSTICAFDQIFAHKGITNESTVNVSNFSATVPNSTTLTVTFTADSNTKNFSLYLFYDIDKDINIDDYLKDLRIVIQEVEQ